MVLELFVRAVIVLFLLGSLCACDRQSGDAPQAPAKESIGRVDISHVGEDAPAIPFTRPDGAPATLGAFRGKPLIVNLWATWCAPCVIEMPTLDRLAQREKGRIAVIVVSQDLEGAKVVPPFFAKHGFTALTPYRDDQNVLMRALKTDILPTTIFYDADGKEAWRVLGSMDWSGERARKLIEGAVNPVGAQ